MNPKRKAILAFVIIFVLGVVAGYTLNSLVQPSGTETATRQFENEREQYGQQGDGERNPERARERLAKHLQLTDNQRNDFFEKMSAYFHGVREKVSGFRQEEKEKIQEYYQEFRQDVSDILSESQLEKLDEVAHPDSVDRMRRHERNRSGWSRR